VPGTCLGMACFKVKIPRNVALRLQ
jgi:hypothetical protein